jgi:hypothetical protein
MDIETRGGYNRQEQPLCHVVYVTTSAYLQFNKMASDLIEFKNAKVLYLFDGSIRITEATLDDKRIVKFRTTSHALKNPDYRYLAIPVSKNNNNGQYFTVERVDISTIILSPYDKV